MENKSIIKKIIKFNGEEFTETTYMGITVIIDSNGYYQANKICKDNKKDFYDWRRMGRTIELLEKYSKKLNIFIKIRNREFPVPKNTCLLYKRTGEYHDFQGWYIHPKLINELAMWCDIDYAILINEIVDVINEEVKLRNITLEEKISEMKETVEALKIDKEIQNEIITKQNEMINTYKQTIELNNETIKSLEKTINLNNEIINEHTKTIESQVIDLDILNKRIEKYDEEIQNKNNIIKNKCVNTKTDSRKFRIYDITQYIKDEKPLNPFDEKCFWKVSANQENKYSHPILLDVVLVSSMHARIDINQHLYSKIINKRNIGNIVKHSSKEYIYNYIINDLKPKRIIKDNIKYNTQTQK